MISSCLTILQQDALGRPLANIPPSGVNKKNRKETKVFLDCVVHLRLIRLDYCLKQYHRGNGEKICLPSKSILDLFPWNVCVYMKDHCKCEIIFFNKIFKFNLKWKVRQVYSSNIQNIDKTFFPLSQDNLLKKIHTSSIN